MKQFVLGIVTTAALVGVVALSRNDTTAGNAPPVDSSGIKVETGEKNPWTSLKLNNDAEQFQFAIVSDRTGGHRAQVFSRAVQQVNLLQPQFVMSVGDLIEGYTQKEDLIKDEWDELEGYVKRFDMPFFYVPGNHDLTNKVQVAKWGERFGKRYYNFTYKNTLFVCLNSENPPDGMSTIDKEQQEWVAKMLEANKDVRWTFVFLHKPIWTAKDLDKNGWAAVEKALAGRNYNVFCGHVHRYQVFERNGMKYYQLATTGGGSRMRGQEYGEFDHIAWVTMKKDKPLIANVMLEGILPADLKNFDSDEKGSVQKKKTTYTVSGKLTLDGKPLAGATVTFHFMDPDTQKYRSVCDSLTDDAGNYKMTTYSKFDGCPAGEYAVVVVKTGKGYADGETKEKSLISEKYATPATSPLRVTVKDGTNTLDLELMGK